MKKVILLAVCLVSLYADINFVMNDKNGIISYNKNTNIYSFVFDGVKYNGYNIGSLRDSYNNTDLLFVNKDRNNHYTIVMGALVYDHYVLNKDPNKKTGLSYLSKMHNMDLYKLTE